MQMTLGKVSFTLDIRLYRPFSKQYVEKLKMVHAFSSNGLGYLGKWHGPFGETLLGHQFFSFRRIF